MRGSVVRRGDLYYVKIELDPDPLTGRRRQKWHSGFRTKKEAERARVDLLSKFDRGEYVEPSHQTLGDFLVEWLQTIRPTVRASTHESYDRNLHNHVIAYLGSVKLGRIDAGALNGLYALLLESGKRQSSRKGKGYSPEVVARALELRADGVSLKATAATLRVEFEETARITKDTLASLLRRHAAAAALGGGRPDLGGLDRRTVQYVHTILHRAFKDAVRWGRLSRNPCDAADPPRGGQKSDGVKTWDAATLRSFLLFTAESQDRDHALWVLLATTGMRRGEAIGVRWTDLDLDTGRLRVVQTVVAVRGQVSVGEPKTTSGRRPIALDPSTVAVLRVHRKRMLGERIIAGDDFEDHSFVFHRPNGTRMSPETVSARFKRQVRKAGLPYLTPKGLRHTWATLALEAGIHPKVVQERLGHANVNITLGIYSHVSPTMHDEAAAQIAGMILDPATIAQGPAATPT